MLEYREALTAEEIRKIRLLSQMRFAIDFAPQAFASYVSTDEDGERFQLTRLPADTDPNIFGVCRKFGNASSSSSTP